MKYTASPNFNQHNDLMTYTCYSVNHEMNKKEIPFIGKVMRPHKAAAAEMESQLPDVLYLLCMFQNSYTSCLQ